MRKALEEINGVFDFTKLPELLSVFFSDLLVIQIDSEIDIHEGIITPCLLIKNQDHQTHMYVVLNIEKENVLIFDEHKKDYSISIEKFQHLLNGSTAILKENESYHPSKKLLEAYHKEQEDDKTYLENIKVIDDFLSKKECEDIVKFYEDHNLFQRSRVAGNSSTSKLSDYRTSSSAMMEMGQTMSFVNDLKQKIVSLLGCEINDIVSLQCVRYYESEGFKPHFDSYVKKRRLTCLLYLNEGFLGGETYFPEIHFGVTPKTGRLLVFQNLDKYDTIITQSFHQGSPVIKGKKYACNIWIEN
ncbi:MAG: 2OG-Fe(II) oxygenase [Psychroserpens sp.]|uniref:prolyl hydroxylase family protein n=1 Tax=Psychroserpens sp. TaxID=2020870 RepID=UPI003C760E75